MKPTTAVCVAACALLCSPLLAAQTSSSPALIRHVATYSGFVLVVKADGAVVGWGREQDGLAARPRSGSGVIGVPTIIDLPGKARQVAVGDGAAYALLEDGTVVSWGINYDGQLGNGPAGASSVLGVNPKPSVTPVKVTGLADIIQVGAGAVSGAVRDDGTVWVWGSNASAMMGNGEGPLSPDDPGGRNLLPLQVKGIAGARRLSLGMGHAAVLLADGTLRMWGHDGFGQIGVGTSGFYHEKPVKVTALTNVAAVYLGGPHSFAVRTDGTLWMWGFAFSGQGIFGKNLKVPTLVGLE